MKRHQVDPERRALMQRVRQSGTDLENAVAALLIAAGHRYRRNVAGLPGSPDFANRTRRWAVFVNGCFWHFHKGCKLSKIPASNSAFWEGKRRQNRSRDARKVRDLRALGYRVLIVWQCELEPPDEVLARLSKLREARGKGLRSTPLSFAKRQRENVDDQE